MARPMASPAAPPAMTSRASSTTRSPPSASVGPAEEEHGDSDRGHHPAHRVDPRLARRARREPAP